MTTETHNDRLYELNLEAAGVKTCATLWAHLEPRSWRDAIGQS
jgi:hypothetical protein